jgi:hypothetical protein
MRARRRQKGIPRRRYIHAGIRLACVFFCAVISISGTTTAPGCYARIDSLVLAGKKNLAKNDIVNARRCFAEAYTCGMSKDSMCYFAAEIYLQASAFDTALTFNYALEKVGHFKPETYLEQRARILHSLKNKRGRDSLPALFQKKDRYDASVNTSASRSVIALKPFTLTPINFDFKPGVDLDDKGNEGFRFKWSRRHDSRLKRTFVTFNVNTDLPVPTRYSFDEKSDTMLRAISLQAGAGDLPSAAECQIGERIAVHPDMKTDHFSSISLGIPVWKTRILQAEHETKWTGFSGLDDSRTQIIISHLLPGLKRSFFYGLTLSHHYSQTDFYQNKSGLSGIYRTIRVGYIDSLNLADSTQPRLRYFRDSSRTQPFDSDFLDEYWAEQPSMRLLTFPHHDVSLCIQSAWQRKLPLRINLIVADFIQCAWYPQKMTWFSIDDTVHISFYDLYMQDAVIYNPSDGGYYITTQRQQLAYMKNSLVPLKKHEKTRIDCFISGTIILEKELGIIGKLYCASTFVKGLSTLSEKDPLVCLDRYWEFRAGWKKDITFHK